MNNILVGLTIQQDPLFDTSVILDLGLGLDVGSSRGSIAKTRDRRKAPYACISWICSIVKPVAFVINSNEAPAFRRLMTICRVLCSRRLLVILIGKSQKERIIFFLA